MRGSGRVIQVDGERIEEGGASEVAQPWSVVLK